MKIALSLVALLALAVGGWQLMEWRNLPPEVTFAKAQRETISSYVSTNGKVDPSESAQARAEASGRVDTILVKLRQNVQMGDALVQLDTGQLRHDLESAEARIAAVRSDLAVIDAGGRQPEKVGLQTQIDSANVELKAAQEEYDKRSDWKPEVAPPASRSPSASRKWTTYSPPSEASINASQP